MDVKGNTQICLSPVRESEARTQIAAPLPMYLIMVRGGMTGTMLRLGGEPTSLGRSGENTYQFHDATVSRRHAVLSYDSDGRAWLTDVGSSNGTFVDGKKLAPNKPTRVEEGSRVQLGAALVLKYVSLDPCDERFQREMFERAVRDNLTGLYNRAYFLEQIGPLCDRNVQRDLGLAILMVDIDRFKQINDEHGHDAGDTVLREVARVLRESTRLEDLVARYGGEEFVFALPVASLDQAVERAERVRIHLAQRTMHANGKQLHVTVSIGLSCSLSGWPRSISGLISAADEALYEAKLNGRNRVVPAFKTPLVSLRRTESADAMAVC
ncbi:MAG: GGDEF domain-containing protein [Paludisphaera borealis]|uniref:GGDEF domain-containing protein n=1 Tax=Paludisphaera borealis TaxID=1387353 RepID=UPI00284764D2|nr:GGDEF domain-containing protein [Paludisphaera borealis]MDR3621402.1 GGDEF domain-containing protein [Paludisphaera borealis]